MIHPSSARYFGLDLARAVAISVVIFSHFVSKLDFIGSFGVELFFALSGYLIGSILWKNFSTSATWTFKHVFNFWQRRWWRTLPSYYLFFLVFYVFQKKFAVLPSQGILIDHLWFGQNLTKLYGEFFYGVSWSLCIEEWFYLTFPVTLFLLAKLITNKKVAFMATIAVFFTGCLFIRLYFSIYAEGQGPLLGITICRLDAIASGVMMAYLVNNYNLASQRKKILLIPATLGVLSPLIARFSPLSHEMASVITLFLVPAGFALALPFLADINQFTNKRLSSSIQKISLWSYSMYLSHIPILFTLYELMGSSRNSLAGNLFSKIAGLLLCVILSAFLFKYFESFFTKMRPHELNSKSLSIYKQTINPEIS